MVELIFIRGDGGSWTRVRIRVRMWVYRA